MLLARVLIPGVQDLLLMSEDALTDGPQLAGIVAARIGQADRGVEPELGVGVLWAADMDVWRLPPLV